MQYFFLKQMGVTAQAMLFASGLSTRAASVPDSHGTFLPVQDMICPFWSDMFHGSPLRGQTCWTGLRQAAGFRTDTSRSSMYTIKYTGITD